MSQKYRQPGYRDKEEPSEKFVRPKNEFSREGPRSPKMPGLQKVVRCGLCGARIPPSFDEIELMSRCPKCGADLHSCRNCVNFDPASRFECTQPIPRRVFPKDRRAECEFFEIKSSVEKIVSSTPSRDVDPRQAFEDLFRK